MCRAVVICERMHVLHSYLLQLYIQSALLRSGMLAALDYCCIVRARLFYPIIAFTIFPGQPSQLTLSFKQT